MRNEILIILGLLILFTSFDFKKVTKLKDGYYFSTHGHASTLFKIKGEKIEWYSDNTVKAWACGKYVVSGTDSIVNVRYNEIWKSTERGHELQAKVVLSLEWDEQEQLFKLRDYIYREKNDALIGLQKRVRSSCRVKVQID